MKRSNTSIAALKKSTNKSLGYGLKDDSIVYKRDYYQIAGMRAAGSINSSANDMAHWLIAWINNGEFNEQSIIPKKYRSQAIRSQMVMGGNLPSKKRPGMHFANYGLGWMLSSYNGHYRVEHGGNIDGFSANVAFYPSDSIGVVVLVNQNASQVPGLVRNTIVDKLINSKSVSWVDDYVKRLAERKEAADTSKTESILKNAKPSRTLVEYTGKYTHKGYGTFEVVEERDSLWAIFPINKYFLGSSGYDVFEAFEVKKNIIETNNGVLVNFVANTTGDIANAQIAFEPTLDPLVFVRTSTKLELTQEELNKYIGDYSIKGLSLKIYSKEKSKLRVIVPGQPEYELIAVGKNKFNLKGLAGYQLEYLEGPNKELTKLKVKQPNGTFLATKK